jgi:hypothetical protein
MAKKQKIPATSEVKPRYARAFWLEQKYATSEEFLANLRNEGTGPEYIKAGHRTIIYDVEKFEAWLAAQPRGGIDVTKSRLRRGRTAA